MTTSSSLKTSTYLIQKETCRNEQQHDIDSLHPDTISHCSDGSSTESGRGVGLIITKTDNSTIIHKNSHKIPDYCTVFQAELTAIWVTCEYLHNYSDRHIVIRTDKLSSIQAVTALNIKSKTIRDCYNGVMITPLTNLATRTQWSCAGLQLTLTFGVTNRQMSQRSWTQLTTLLSNAQSHTAT